MQESYFQNKFRKQLKKEGFEVWVFADAFTDGIPDTYVARGGEGSWFELKVNHASEGQTVHLSDEKGGEHGFSRAQALKCYKLKQRGVRAQGLVYMVHTKKIIVVEPEQFNESVPYEEFMGWEEFDSNTLP